MKKIVSFLQKHPLIVSIACALLLGFLTALFSSSNSPILYKTFNTNSYVKDGNMFSYLGLLLSKGYTPYVEAYDHKGLYLFYYVALGYIISPICGVFLVQIVVLSSFYFIFFKILKLYEFRLGSRIFSCILFAAIYSIGHQSPSDFEIQLPFVALAIYYYSKAIKDDNDKEFIIANIFAGIQAGVAFNVRASDAMIALSMIVYFAIRFIRKKNGLGILLNASIFIISFVAICLPPLIHGLVGGFVLEMYEATILTNFSYVGTVGNYHGNEVLICRIILIVSLFIFAACMYSLWKKISIEERIFHICSISIVWIIQMVIAFYPHYFFICLPYVALFICYTLTKIKFKNIFKFVGRAFAVSTFVASAIFFPTYYHINQSSTDVAIKEYIDACIPKESKEGHVLVYRGSSAIYLNSNLLAGYGDFNCQDNHMLISKTFSKENLIKYFESDKSHYVIIQSDIKDDSDEVLQYFYTQIQFPITYKISDNVNPLDYKGSQYIYIFERI